MYAEQETVAEGNEGRRAEAERCGNRRPDQVDRRGPGHVGEHDADQAGGEVDGDVTRLAPKRTGTPHGDDACKDRQDQQYTPGADLIHRQTVGAFQSVNQQSRG